MSTRTDGLPAYAFSRYNCTARRFGIDRRCDDKVLKREAVMAKNPMSGSVISDENYSCSDVVHQAAWNTAISNIMFPGPGQLRSRKIVSRSSARPKGKYPSWKMRRMLQWEPENELNAFRSLDCDPDAMRFHEQPCEVVYVLDGQVRSHYPDILVEKN